ncbi:MAG: hypothetical protein HQ568_09220, partial [Calditrichaeota bacterium]|nr:hypothetical protein [Calditrichota bacterium]
TAFVFSNAIAADYNIIPRGGFSIPIGSVSDAWNSGYAVELDLYGVEINRLKHGVRISYNRWLPNSEEILKTGAREFNIEREEGWQSIVELMGLVSYRLVTLPKKLGSLHAEGGFGVCHIRSPKVIVKGFHVSGDIALNRDVTIAERAEVKPGLSAGLSMTIADRIEPMVRYNYIFTSGEGTGMLTLGIGLLAK